MKRSNELQKVYSGCFIAYNAAALARDIDRFAEQFDYYDYMDYLETECNGDISESVYKLYGDIVISDTKYIIDWFAEIATDINSDHKTRNKATNLFYRLHDMKMGEC